MAEEQKSSESESISQARQERLAEVLYLSDHYYVPGMPTPFKEVSKPKQAVYLRAAGAALRFFDSEPWPDTIPRYRLPAPTVENARKYHAVRFMNLPVPESPAELVGEIADLRAFVAAFGQEGEGALADQAEARSKHSHGEPAAPMVRADILRNATDAQLRNLVAARNELGAFEDWLKGPIAVSRLNVSWAEGSSLPGYNEVARAISKVASEGWETLVAEARRMLQRKVEEAESAILRGAA